METFREDSLARMVEKGYNIENRKGTYSVSESIFRHALSKVKLRRKKVMSIFAKAKKAKENKKGFTLVELIVVLVILAVLAAILVPALLGWIDKAKEKQYVLEARNITLAAQAVAVERYSKLNAEDADKTLTFTKDEITEIGKIADEPNITSVTVNDVSVSSTHDKYTIAGITIVFISTSDGKTSITATLADGSWEIKKTS